MPRTALSVMFIASVAISQRVAAASDPKDAWLGAVVVANRPHAALHMAGRVCDPAAWGAALRVSQVHGSWLWVGQGWLRTADAIRCQDAVVYFSRSLAQRPSAFAFVSRGVARREMRQESEALKDFSDAIRLEPREFRAFRERAATYARQGKKEAAIADYTAAIGLCPSDPAAHIGRALAWGYRAPLRLDRGDHQRALADLARAIRLAPTNGEAYATRALIYYEFAEYDAALRDANEAIRRDPSPANYVTRASIFYALGRHVESCADFDEAERIDTTDLSRSLRKLYEGGAIVPLATRAAHAKQNSAKDFGSGAVAGIPANVNAPAAAVIDEFDISKIAEAVIVPVTIKGVAYQFLVDTGSTCSVFNIVHRDLLGESIGALRAQTATDVQMMNFYTAPAMNLGRTVLQPQAGVLCADLRIDELMAETKIDGILGSDVLQQIVMSIDFDRGKVRILSSVGPESGLPVPLVWHKRRDFSEGPFVMASLNGGNPTEFLVDLGDCGLDSGSLAPELFDQEVCERRIELIGGPLVMPGTNGGATVKTRLARAGGLRLGGYELRGLVFARSAKFNSLGASYLSRFTVTLDLGNDMMYLRPARTFSRLDTTDLSGLGIVRRRGEFLVASVAAGSLAEAAGILKDDMLRRVGDRLASEIRRPELKKILSTPGDCRLMLSRSGKEYTVTMKLHITENSAADFAAPKVGDVIQGIDDDASTQETPRSRLLP